MMNSTNINGQVSTLEDKTKMSRFFQFLLKINLLPAKIEASEKNLKFNLFSKQMLGFLVMIIVVVAVPFVDHGGSRRWLQNKHKNSLKIDLLCGIYYL